MTTDKVHPTRHAQCEACEAWANVVLGRMYTPLLEAQLGGEPRACRNGVGTVCRLEN